MRTSHASIIASFPRSCPTVVLGGSEAVGFGAGDFDDLIIVKPLRKPARSVSLYVEGKRSKVTAPAAGSLYKKYRSILDRGSVGSFSLTARTISTVKRAIQKLDATHVRMTSNNDGIHVSIFDLRKFVPDLRLRRQHDIMLVTGTVSAQDRDQFSITLLAATFRTLPVAESVVSVDPSGVAKVSFEDGSVWLMRDQTVVPPVTTFSNAPLGEEIVLWLHPK